MVYETMTEKETDGQQKVNWRHKDTDMIAIKVVKTKYLVKVKIIQFGVNSNKATTGHKLQRVSLNRVVVISWNYSTLDWSYVVLSRVNL